MAQTMGQLLANWPCRIWKYDHRIVAFLMGVADNPLSTNGPLIHWPIGPLIHWPIGPLAMGSEPSPVTFGLDRPQLSALRRLQHIPGSMAAERRQDQSLATISALGLGTSGREHTTLFRDS